MQKCSDTQAHTHTHTTLNNQSGILWRDIQRVPALSTSCSPPQSLTKWIIYNAFMCLYLYMGFGYVCIHAYLYIGSNSLSTCRLTCKFHTTEWTLYKIQLSFWKSLYRFTFCQRLNVYVCFWLCKYWNMLVKCAVERRWKPFSKRNSVFRAVVHQQHTHY